MARSTSKVLKWSLRVMAGLSAVLGLGFIVWGCIVQNPPETALTMYVSALKIQYSHNVLIKLAQYCSGMIVLGSLALAVGGLGFLSSVLGRWCLSVLLLVAMLVSLGELALIISLVADLDGAVAKLVDSELNAASDNTDDVQQGVYVLFHSYCL